jgi:hypothetical protein
LIKILIENIGRKKDEFYLNIKDLLLHRISILETVLENLGGSAIQTNGIHLSSLKPVVLSVIKLVEKPLPKLDLNGRKNYIANLKAYVKGPNNFNKINSANLLKYLKQLKTQPDVDLKLLLCSPPEQLFTQNQKILADFHFLPIDIKVLKLAFDYTSHDEISSRIRGFFRTYNFVKYCPYCNYVKVIHYNTKSGKRVATSHELDHFFDKATYPLLCYSFFNLIPSDTTCNKTNKHDTQFSDKFHLNPYSEGFGSSIKYIPKLSGYKTQVSDIDIKINEHFGSKKYKQLFGLSNNVDEDSEDGSFNVFKLKTKYHDKNQEAERILKTLRKTNDGFSSIRKFIRQMFSTKRNNNYIEWYEEEFSTPFIYRRFNEKAFSKFNRDIHDYYYEQISESSLNNYIKRLILKHHDESM